MKIDEQLLLRLGATYQEYQAKEVIFFEGATPRCYMQIEKGSVELNIIFENGKEFIVGLFSEGNSIAESVLFTDQPYPVNAVAKTDCSVLKLDKNNFLELLRVDPDIALSTLERLSTDLLYQYNIHTIIAESQPLSKIKALFDYLKTFNGIRHDHVFKVPFTRQEIANILGLRVETVIRTVKKTEQDCMLAIRERKIYY
jgi:CRP-like cAMP-binding protein